MRTTDILALLPPVPGGTAVVLCDGVPPSHGLLRDCLADARLFLCADGAGRPYEALPRRPDLVIGDFDTLGRLDTPGGTTADPVPHAHDPDQTTTDGEKAVAHAAEEGCGRVLLLGADGGHLDHALANCALPDRCADLADVVLVNDCGVTWRVTSGANASLDLPRGATLSLNPCGAPAHGVSLTGVRWPLLDAALSWGGPVAISNRVSEPPVRLSLAAGSLLLTVRADAA